MRCGVHTRSHSRRRERRENEKLKARASEHRASAPLLQCNMHGEPEESSGQRYSFGSGTGDPRKVPGPRNTRWLVHLNRWVFRYCVRSMNNVRAGTQGLDLQTKASRRILMRILCTPRPCVSSANDGRIPCGPLFVFHWPLCQ